MFIGTRIVLNGIKLYETFGLMAVNEGGKQTSPYGVSQNIIEDKVPFNDIPYLQNVERTPLEFDMVFAMQNDWSDKMRLDFANLLFKKKYIQLFSEDYPYVIYNVICTGTPVKESSNTNQLIIRISFRCDSGHGWSPDTLQTYNLMNNTGKTILYLENKSNINEYEYPVVEIFSVKDNNEIKVVNHTDGGRGFTISKLEQNEIVNIDNKLSIVTTNIPNVYRYSNFDGKWLRLRQGLNNVEITGQCYFTVKTKVAVAL